MEGIQIQKKWNWSATSAVAILHAASIYAIAYGVMNDFSLGNWALFGTFNLLTIIGVSMGYHRFVTHDSFKCVWPLKLLLLVFGGLAFQGHAIGWARNHRTHHAYADKDGDPHSPKDGFWRSHMIWFMRKYTAPDYKTMCPDLLRDRLIVSQKYWVIFAGASGFILPFFLFGWEGVLLAGTLRLLFASHAIFAINSICHTWGERPYATDDTSTNNLFLAWLIPSGEPFHNNHHADPRCAYLGWHWYNPDIGKWTLQILSLARFKNLRLVWNVRKPRPDIMKKIYAKIEKRGEPSTASMQ